jgi:hypothetical protein
VGDIADGASDDTRQFPLLGEGAPAEHFDVADKNGFPLVCCSRCRVCFVHENRGPAEIG